MTVSLLVASSTRAFADDSQSAEGRARAAFEQGLAAERAGDAAGACARFEESLSLVRELGPLGKVAECDAAHGDLVAAIAKLEELASRMSADSERARVTARRDELRARVAHLTLRVAPDVRVRLDGREWTASQPDSQNPGSHVVEVVAPPARWTDSGSPSRAVRHGYSAATQGRRGSPSGGPSPLLIGGVVLGARWAGVSARRGDRHRRRRPVQKRRLRQLRARLRRPPKSEGDTLLVANAVTWGATVLLGGLASRCSSRTRSTRHPPPRRSTGRVAGQSPPFDRGAAALGRAHRDLLRLKLSLCSAGASRAGTA
ncbi:MAG: hypothetical protein U0271_31165 [Polyangiaceae bacterium]